MRWWWSWESKKSLRERLAAREAWLKHADEQAALWQKEYLTIWRELSHAHAALRRKGKALKELHKRVQYHKDKRPEGEGVMSKLSREQVEVEIIGFYTAIGGDLARQVGLSLLDTDAALRAQLEASEQHLEQQRTATYQAVEREHKVKQQLAASEQRVAILHRTISDHVASYTMLEQRQITTHQQLEAAQATVTRLEERLEIGFAFDMDGKRVTIPKDSGPDGISCRDATIALQDEEIGTLQATVTAQQEEIGRLRLALRYLAELGSGNSEGNYYAKAALKREDNIRATLASGKETR